jgi:hypothetical protein
MRVPARFPRRVSPKKTALIPGLRKEKVMSKTCGDTARFHRLRKQKINRRAKNRLLQAEIAARKAEKAAKPTA